MKRLLCVAVSMVRMFAGLGNAAIPSTERAALLALYNSTNGPGWTRETNWNGPPGTECTWYGITCGGDNVISIRLDNNKLTGTISPSLTVFKLIEFRVSYNELTGAIPSLSGMPYLQEFWVNRNKLTGAIPSLSGLTFLRNFFAGDNQLTGTIPSLGGLTSLLEIQIHNNQLTGTIPSLGGLTSLRGFWASNNKLTGLFLRSVDWGTCFISGSLTIN